ncbi:hypothetical protein [Methylocucumis oryzae]|uniref:Uncharacterized protein n=1 Tax=Methylocucumis oryzae TaxID=1632867 RepID=A0A0F3IKT9_9GAMM|nr:hypothetical protein [Methylocucumis oryzae]KJV07138.1 hypothetical protein VZ94_06735 [Methylocucumis oryzae]
MRRTCSKAKAAISAADAKQTKAASLYHIVVQDKYAKDFWLHLEMNGSAKLKDLDSYLRAMWLECCRHLSEFSVSTLMTHLLA